MENLLLISWPVVILGILAMIVIAVCAALFFLFKNEIIRRDGAPEATDDSNIDFEIMFTSDALDQKCTTEEQEEVKIYYDETNVTRPILIKMLNDAGIRGVTKLSKADLLEKVKQEKLKFPEKQ